MPVAQPVPGPGHSAGGITPPQMVPFPEVYRRVQLEIRISRRAFFNKVASLPGVVRRGPGAPMHVPVQPLKDVLDYDFFHATTEAEQADSVLKPRSLSEDERKILETAGPEREAVAAARLEVVKLFRSRKLKTGSDLRGFCAAYKQRELPLSDATPRRSHFLTHLCSDNLTHCLH